jgi:translation elongation factor EF-Ts
MANITAAMVKDLRERTGLGMMDCKKRFLKRMAISKKRSTICVKRAA